MAGSDYFLGRPRCPRALPDLSNGGRRSRTREMRFQMGEVSQPLASSGRMRGFDSRCKRENVFPADFQIIGHADIRPRRHGAKGCRPTAKADPKRTIPYLMRIRKNAPRLVLRTACETLPRAAR